MFDRVMDSFGVLFDLHWFAISKVINFGKYLFLAGWFFNFFTLLDEVGISWRQGGFYIVTKQVLFIICSKIIAKIEAYFLKKGVIKRSIINLLLKSSKTSSQNQNYPLDNEKNSINCRSQRLWLGKREKAYFKVFLINKSSAFTDEKWEIAERRSLCHGLLWGIFSWGQEKSLIP